MILVHVAVAKNIKNAVVNNKKIKAFQSEEL